MRASSSCRAKKVSWLDFGGVPKAIVRCLHAQPPRTARPLQADCHGRLLVMDASVVAAGSIRGKLARWVLPSVAKVSPQLSRALLPSISWLLPSARGLDVQALDELGALATITSVVHNALPALPVRRRDLRRIKAATSGPNGPWAVGGGLEHMVVVQDAGTELDGLRCARRRILQAVALNSTLPHAKPIEIMLGITRSLVEAAEGLDGC
mmetsp:Transcript_33382/g.100582  ORF Transcript_33382/g.100582 Transcript_33382/m.100582 type:complete len:209 (-) Transcript_33382:328-954(-)